MSAQRGFSIIELLTAVAILALLTSIAVVSYLNYTARARAAEALVLAAPIKLQVRVAYQEGVPLPFDHAKLNLPDPADLGGDYVSSITVSGAGVITAVFGAAAGNALDGGALEFVPVIEAGSISFTCNGPGTTIAPRYRPQICR